MSIEEYESEVQKGKHRLVVLDDLVLDVTRFANSHPGGRFLIEKNSGKDISKFFHGGYNYEPANGGWNHTHTNYARTVVNSLIVARLEDKRSSALVRISNQTNASKSGSVSTYEFRYAPFEEEGAPLVESIKLFYPEVSMLGKHYLVQQASSDGVFGNARHYTVSNCMRPDVYNAYVEALKDQNADTSAITSNPKDCDLTLTIKEYRDANGLSASIASNSSAKQRF